MMPVYVSYGFSEAALESGEERTFSVEVTGTFRGQKILMAASMKPIRGHFKIKRTLLPDLDRDDVVAYSRVYRCRRGKKIWFRPGKKYIHTDPLEYISLRNLHIGKVPQMPIFERGGIPAVCFGVDSFGNGLRMDTVKDMSVSLILKNDGDVQVRVWAMLLGIGLG